MLYLYILRTKKLLETEILKKSYLQLHQKKIKHLGIRLSKEVKDILSKLTLMQVTKDQINR